MDINSYHNENADPEFSIYPRLSIKDAPYSIEEALLRAVIHIPDSFQFGQDGKTPIILVPGTGSYGGENFAPNYAKLLAASSFADPVWLNIPGRMCDDAAKNAEYVAYAVNYISIRCGSSSSNTLRKKTKKAKAKIDQQQQEQDEEKTKMAVLGWSQGNISIQWALKYWPSTRDQVNNFIALSADFRGTIMARTLIPFKGILPAAPAIWNQLLGSNFITTLRSNGGDSAYVPTTSIYSAIDEAVQPQFGPNASALMKDERNVGVTNCQLVGTPSIWKPVVHAYAHDGVLISPLAWALTEDALTNGGPGRLDRIDLDDVCAWSKTIPGISLLDTAKSRTISICCLMNIFAFKPKVWNELPLPPYATATSATEQEDIDNSFATENDPLLITPSKSGVWASSLRPREFKATPTRLSPAC